MPPVRRLAAILAADVAGYSRLMGEDEEGTHERLQGHLRELVNPKITEHRGRIVKNTGDGILVEFSSVVDAVRCAVEVQRGMNDREPDVPQERRIRFRIGVNLGDVIVEEHDIFGDGVNVAARLEALAEPSGICVSRVVRDQVRDKLDFAFEDLGEQSVKNIARPVRVYAWRHEAIADLPATGIPVAARRRRSIPLVAVGSAVPMLLLIAVGTWWLWPMTKPSPPAVAATTTIAQPFQAARLSIVVLPFANLSNDPDQQYFADGITEDLTTNLSRIPHMLVISRNTAFTYRNKPSDTKQIGRELGVRYVLEGSVQRSVNRVRVTAQLIYAENDTHLWAERFDRDMDDLFALQNEVTGRIAVALNIELIGAEAARPTDNPDALDYIFRGRAAGLKPTSRDTYAAMISMYERALALDPRSVEAQGLLANMLASRVLDGLTDSAAADIARAEGLVAQALAASPRSPTAHIAKGQLVRAQGRCDEAIPEFETALSIDRNRVPILNILAGCKLSTGSIEEVIPLEEQAIRLSPRDPLIGHFYCTIGHVYLLQSRTDEAILWLQKARTAVPELPFVHGLLAAAYGLKGDTDRAAAELAEARRVSNYTRYSSIAQIKAISFGYSVLAPKIRALTDATNIAGLRKAGLPEE
jgi:TolB-like protein/class 3 adenylate cyclase/Flp pilus assembly protein TadD